MVSEKAKSSQDTLTYQQYLEEYKAASVGRTGLPSDDPKVVANELAEATIRIIRRGISSVAQICAQSQNG